MTTPNAQQQRLIDSTDGIHVVDAGAGTGKTFTVTRRYAAIVDQPHIDPADVLLVTFTNNAASEMKDRVVANSTYRMRELADAPIQTFHSFCHELLMEHGFTAPTLLGIDDRITSSTRLLEDESIESERFREFIHRFSDAHPEYDDHFRAISKPTELLGLIKQLAAKGVFPTTDGWYRNGERDLDGNYAAFKTLFYERNEPRNGGGKQSELREALNDYGTDKCYLPDAPDKTTLRGQGTKQVPPEIAREVFEEDREELKAFVHDIYHAYLSFALRRNYLNFGFLQLFAFVLLCEDHELRQEVAFEYTMIDEFQDTSEIQFKLALLLAGTQNFCVVGDWKQSIYSFQYATVENITRFEPRLNRFIAELNEDTERVSWSTSPITEIELVENYRSTQRILDFSEQSLVTKATKNETVDTTAIQDQIVSLSSNATHENSHIEAIQHEDEQEAVLTKIQEIVGNDAYQVEEEGELRLPDYGDIAVLTRTRDFGRELLSTAAEYDLPMAYEGGLELLRSDPAKLLLAWLRILESNAERGWAVVLEETGYTIDEIQHILEHDAYPTAMADFKTNVATLETVGAVARRVFSRYGHDEAAADVLLTTIQSIHDSTTLTRGDLIRFIERGIDEGTTHEVHANAGTDSVTVQTIHAAKGLEYPIVLLANMNTYRFPPSGGGNSTITYDNEIGVRQRKRYAETYEYPYVFDNWRTDVLQKCLPRDYDEERRLLYVAMTRAKSHLIFSAGKKPNAFIENLSVEIKALVPDVQQDSGLREKHNQLEIEVPELEGPIGFSPHSLMDESVYEDVEGGRGPEFGTRIHELAERYVRGESTALSNENDHERHLKDFLDSLDGELVVEENAYLPLTVDGERVILSGVIDLVQIRPETVDVIDFKTDQERQAESEYRKQLSVYYHVLNEQFPERDVSVSLFYTTEGERIEIEPLSQSELGALTNAVMAEQRDEQRLLPEF